MTRLKLFLKELAITWKGRVTLGRYDRETARGKFYTYLQIPCREDRSHSRETVLVAKCERVIGPTTHYDIIDAK